MMRRSIWLFLPLIASPAGGAFAEDCNDNGIDDSLDLMPRDGFLPAASLPAGEHPVRLLSVDLDDDGALDLAVSTYPGLSLFRNEGQGIFGKRREIPLMDNGATSALAAADLDGDGLPDIAAVISNHWKLAVLMNQSALRFEVSMLDSGRNPVDIGASDLDGDGDLDLAVANFGGNNFSTFLNSGNGTLDLATQYTVGVGIRDCRPLSLAIADLDRDGDPDIAVSANVVSASVTNIVAVFTNADGGVFQDPVAIEVGVEIPRHVAAGDLDGDGYPELLAAVSDQVFVFPNIAGELGSPRAFHAGPPYDVYFLATADLEGDGDLDVLAAVCSSPPHLAILRNDGAGVLGDPEDLPVGQCPVSAIAADLDGNGALDLASANGNSNDVSLLYSDRLPPTSKDENGNGVPDECEARPSFHRGDPEENGVVDISDAVFVLSFAFLAGPAPGCRESADANNDGRIDLTDAVVILSYLFRAGPPPAEPGPHLEPCGPDPDTPGSAADLGCTFYGVCQAGR